MEREKADFVVVDAVAFFKNVQLQNFAKSVLTVRSVVDEIRDSKTRQRLAVLPYELRFREPSSESIQFVSDFARKTGEYGSLSPVDIQVMALAHQMTKEQMGVAHLKKVPEKKITFTSNRKPLEKTTDIVGFYFPKNNESRDNLTENSAKNKDVPLTLETVNMNNDDDDEQTQQEAEQTENLENDKNEKLSSNHTAEEQTDLPNNDCQEGQGQIQRPEDGNLNMNEEDSDKILRDGEDKIPSEQLEDDKDITTNEKQTEASGDTDEGVMDDEEEDDDDEDDEVGWITPQNLQKAKSEMQKDIYDSLEEVNVACLTTDFAMQNCLIQMGIPVLSVEGMVIKKAKSFALRCFACFKVTSDTNRKFCPKCGNQTLNKVSVSVDDAGNTHYHMSRRRNYKVGELRQTLPLPKGGKHSQNPLVCEDQPFPQNRVSRKAMMRNNVFDPDYVAQNSPFVTRDVTSRSAMLGVGRNRQNRRGRRK